MESRVLRTTCIVSFFLVISVHTDDTALSSSPLLSSTRAHFLRSGRCTAFVEDEERRQICLAIQRCVNDNDLHNVECRRLLGDDEHSNDNFSQGGSLVTNRDKPGSALTWVYGLVCVSVISGASLLGVGVLPFMSKAFYQRMLTALIGLAVGSLTGSALFHLIPSSFLLSEVSFYSHHSYLNTSLVIWLGIYMFFIIERALKLFMALKQRSSGMETVSSNVEGEVYEHSKQAIKASFGHMERPENETRMSVEGVLSLEEQTHSTIATVAYMIIFGDGVHNFIDGLSIGAAFSQSTLTGLSVSLAVLCEELPHELGDFAVLLNAGMTVKQAMVYNFLSACTCYLGLFVGLVLGEVSSSEYIFALAGGMFLYIALVDMVPEMNETTDHAQNLKEAGICFLLQNLGVCTGIIALFALAKCQDDIQIQL